PGTSRPVRSAPGLVGSASLSAICHPPNECLAWPIQGIKKSPRFGTAPEAGLLTTCPGQLSQLRVIVPPGRDVKGGTPVPTHPRLVPRKNMVKPPQVHPRPPTRRTLAAVAGDSPSANLVITAAAPDASAASRSSRRRTSP